MDGKKFFNKTVYDQIGEKKKKISILKSTIRDQ